MFNLNREVASCPSVMLELTNTKKGNKSHSGNSNGEFLTLTPPAIATKSRFKQSSTTLASHNREFCNFESLTYQVCTFFTSLRLEFVLGKIIFLTYSSQSSNKM